MTDIDQNKLRRLDGGLLLVFRELLRSRRASVAAERLGLSQPAISHALSRLRDLFDDPLFIRRPHGFEPTRRALALGPQVDALIDLADAAMTPDRAFNPATSTRLFSLVAPEFVAALIGAELLNRFRSAAPGVRFAIGHADEGGAVRALKAGEIDFALGRFAAAKPGFTVEPLFEDVYCVVARRGHPAIRGSLDLDQWRNTGHVYAWSSSETGPHGLKSDSEASVAMLAAAPQWLTVLLMVAASDAIATVPRRLAERHAGKLGLQVLDPPFTPWAVEVKVMRRTGAADAGADWFLEQVRAAASV